MRTLGESIFRESIFNDINDIVNNDNALIEQFLKDNYKIDASYTIKDGVVDVGGNVDVKNLKLKTLTNGLFRFGVVSGEFDCDDCDKLTSLEGAPEEVGKSFWCINCKNLKSLKGAPKKVGRDFWCNECPNLTSLKGAPKEVGGSIYAFGCDKLTITDQDRKKYNLED